MNGAVILDSKNGGGLGISLSELVIKLNSMLGGEARMLGIGEPPVQRIQRADTATALILRRVPALPVGEGGIVSLRGLPPHPLARRISPLSLCTGKGDYCAVTGG